MIKKNSVSGFNNPDNVSLDGPVSRFLSSIDSSPPEWASVICVFYYHSHRVITGLNAGDTKGPGLDVGWDKLEDVPPLAIKNIGGLKVVFRLEDIDKSYHLSMSSNDSEIVFSEL